MLYSRLSNLLIPDSIQTTASGNAVNYQKIRSTAFVNWPDSRPCLAVNMYLLDQGYQWTGDSAITYASEITELVRYCYTRQKAFSDLKDGDVFALIQCLRTETKHRTGTRKRNDNTVRRILNRCLSFLTWYQENLHFSPILLIGDESSGAAIRVKYRKNDRGNLYLSHRYAPESNPTEPKFPIDLAIIEAINSSIEFLSFRENYHEAVIRKFKGNLLLFDQCIYYLYARRKFMVWVLQRTGLRPSEMAGLSVRENTDAIRKNVLIIPTMKRRKFLPPPRYFPITEKDSRVMMRYLAARDAWIETCKIYYPNFEVSDAMFLSVAPANYGSPIYKAALDKDFRALCKHAGHKDSEACFSMFRHRFITWEVFAHLKAWEVEKGRSPTEQDYVSILEKVRMKTGHADPMSLWHYIDLAQDLAGVWINVERAVARLHAADHLTLDLGELRRSLKSSCTQYMANEQIIDMVLERLGEIVGDAISAGIS